MNLSLTAREHATSDVFGVAQGVNLQNHKTRAPQVWGEILHMGVDNQGHLDAYLRRSGFEFVNTVN